MKKILMLAVAMVVALGCDDGKIDVQNISFSGNAPVLKCPNNNTLYLINNNEILLIQINNPADFTSLIKNDNGVTSIPVSSQTKVIYRFYNGDVTLNNFCGGGIPPISPTAVGEWTAASGSISITTTQITSPPNDITNGTRITGYKHTISLKNLDFIRQDGIHQEYETFAFGIFTTTADALPFNFNVPENAGFCSSSNLIYNAIDTGSEALTIENLSPTLLQNVEGIRRELIGDTINVLRYRDFDIPFDGTAAQFICGTTFTAVGAQVYTAVPYAGNVEDGLATGIIEVTTTEVAGSFVHSIALKKVTFKKGESTFYLADSFNFGTIIN